MTSNGFKRGWLRSPDTPTGVLATRHATHEIRYAPFAFSWRRQGARREAHGTGVTAHVLDVCV